MYKLYIDESGKNTLSNIDPKTPHFCVGAVLVSANGTNGAPEFLRNRGNEIRFKYWGPKSEAVFHANEIRRDSGEFSIFSKDSGRRNEFRADLFQYVNSAGFKYIWVGVNKINWINTNPHIAHAVANGFSLLKYKRN